MLRPFLILFCLLINAPVHAERRPALVPDGWTQEFADQATKTRRFVSPDGRAFLMTKQSPASRSSVDRDMAEIASRPGEQITYQRRGTSWIAVSGYRGDQIFYRKSNLACGGRNWHHIELLYPRTQKQRMDQTVTHIARGMNKYGDDCPKS
jgi:hypothetical protein